MEIVWQFTLMADILIYSDTFEDHLKHVQLVFDRLRAANVSLKAAKCQFFMDEVVFLGHTVNANGVGLEHAKIEALLNFPEPQNVYDELRFWDSTINSPGCTVPQKQYSYGS